MPRVVSLPSRFEGAPFLASEAMDAGVGRERLRGRDLAAPFRGVRVGSSAQDDDELAFRERVRALNLLLGPEDAFSHVTAARLWGVPLPRRLEGEHPLHVTTRRPGTRIRLAGTVGHTSPPDAVLVDRRGYSVTDPVSTWMALAAALHPVELVVAADHLVLTPRVEGEIEQRPFVPLPELADALRRYPGRHVRVLRMALDRVRDGAESAQETRLRLALVDAGLPEPVLNVDVTDARGRFLGRGDMVYPDWGVIVEYDGDHHRTDARQYDKDFTRHEAFTLSGWRHVRVRRFGMGPGAGPASGVARVEAALRAAGWRPAPAEKSFLRPNARSWT